MTSTDSGVDIENDSNDSSIAQQENVSSLQQITNASSTAPVVCNSHEEEPRKPSLFADNIKSLPTFHPYQKQHVMTRSRTNMPDALKLIAHRNRDRVLLGDLYRMRVAATLNNIEMMKMLLEKGVTPNNHDERGRTPLHLAACRGYDEMVRLLLQHGADPNRRDCLGNTPLHLAAVATKISVVTLLLQAGTDVSSLDRHGLNPLQLAQIKLIILSKRSGGEMTKVKEEVRNIVSMLLAYLEKQENASKHIEHLSNFCSRLSLWNTSNQVQIDVQDLLADLTRLNIKN